MTTSAEITCILIRELGQLRAIKYAKKHANNNGPLSAIYSEVLKDLEAFQVATPLCFFCRTPTQASDKGQECPMCGGRPK